MALTLLPSCGSLGKAYEGSGFQADAEAIEGGSHTYEAGAMALGLIVHLVDANDYQEVRAADSATIAKVFESATLDGKPLDQMVLVADRHLLYLKKADYQTAANDVRYLYLFVDKRQSPSNPLSSQRGEIYVSDLGLAALSRRVEGQDSFLRVLINAITGKSSYPSGESSEKSHGH